MNPNIITKDYEITQKEINNDERSIKQYISTTSLDRGKDIMIPKGMDETSFRKNPVVLFNHNTDMVIGRNLWLEKEDRGVLAKTQFANTPFADDIYILNKEGALNAWSIRFIPKTWEFNQEQNITKYTGWELLEYSSVSIPMNQDCINVGKSLVKSDIMKSFFEESEKKNKMIEHIKSFEDEIKSLKENQDKLNLLLQEKDNFDNLEKVELAILELAKEIAEIKKHISVGTLDNKKVFDEILNKVVGEVSRIN